MDIVDQEEKEKAEIVYVDIAVNFLRRMEGKLPFDIYVQRTKDIYTKIFLHGDTIDWVRVASYEEKGLTHFYVTDKEYQSYLMIVEDLASKFVDSNKNYNNEDALQFTSEMVTLSSLELIVKTNIEEHVVEHAAKSVTACIKTLAQNPKGLAYVLNMMKGKRYLIRHSVTTSILSIIFAKSLGYDSDSALMTIGLGALLHDIGTTKIESDHEEFETLSPEQWKDVKAHPEIGKRLLDRVDNLTTEIKTVVLHHHEQPNGLGYPNGLRDREIYVPAKIVAIADDFATMITSREFRDAISSHAALALMKEDQGKYDKRMLTRFDTIFGKKSKSVKK